MSLQQRLLGVILLIFTLSGCSASTMSVTSNHDPSATFSGLKTYDWIPEPQIATGDLRIDNNRLLHVRIRNAVEYQLEARGYTRQPLGTPDFLVGYQVALGEMTSIMVMHDYHRHMHGCAWNCAFSEYRPSDWRNPVEAQVSKYDEGSLILDIVESKPRKLIWRGVAMDEVKFFASRKIKQKQINKMVKQKLERFPPN